MPINPQPVEAFGIKFPSLYALAMDHRCCVSYPLLRRRINRHMVPQEAATKPPQQRIRLKLIYNRIWGQGFVNLEAMAQDPRCMVTVQVLRQRVARGCDPTWASTNRKKGQLAAWGELFANIAELYADIRCNTLYHTLRRRIKAGEPPGVAAE